MPDSDNGIQETGFKLSAREGDFVFSRMNIKTDLSALTVRVIKSN